MNIFFNYVIFVCSAFLLAGIGILISLLGEKVCLSKYCVEHSQSIYRGMNENLDPCDDFYSFVCGNFPKYGSTVVDEVEINQLKLLANYLDEPADPAKMEGMFYIGKTLYSNCINDSQLDFEGLMPASRLIDMIGSIPFLDPYWYTNKRQEEFIYTRDDYLHAMNGFDSVFIHTDVLELQTYPKEKRVGKMRYSIPPHLYNSVAPDPEKWLQYCVEFNDIYSKWLGTNKTITDKEKKAIKEAARFKSKLLEMIDRPNKCSFPYIPMDLPSDFSVTDKNFAQSDSRFQWKYFNQYLSKFNQYDLFTTEKILMTTNFKKYIENLKHLVDKQSDLAVASYMGIQSLIEMTPLLPFQLRELYMKYLANDEEKNNKVIKNRKYHCAKLIKDQMPQALSYYYIKDNPKLIEDITKVTASLNIKKQVEKVFENAKWLHEHDRNKMLLLLRNRLSIVTPFPQPIMEKFKDLTNNFQLYLDACLESTLETYFNLKRMKRKFTNATYVTDYDIFGAKIFFDYDYDSVVVPIGYMTFPSIDPFWPKYLNFGGLAVWIAYTIINTIGYNNELFRKFKDSNKNFQSRQYWKNTSVSHYQSLRECTVSEYNRYLRPFNVKCSDANCLEGVISYAAAVQTAYFAYTNYTEMRFFVEPRLPYMKRYTVDQTFFIKYASLFCRNDGLVFNKYKTDSATNEVPKNFTVLYSLRNFPKFSEAFKCNIYDKMSNTNPCTIWNIA